MNALLSSFEHLQRQYYAQPYPSVVQRKQNLRALKAALKQYQQALCDAVSQDFGYRSQHETHLLEIVPSLNGLNYQLTHLSRWLKPQKRQVHWLFQPARNYVCYQPVGVAGIIVPWNYPIFLALGPLMPALSAGNRVMLKLSEYTPATNTVLRRLLTESLGEDNVIVIEGDANVAADFSALPFNHLLFTGSTAIGYKVMQAAAQNLTPVTLELGGKSPTLIADDANLKTAAERLLFGKTANAGQTCVAPDYILLPEHKLCAFIAAIKQAFSRFYPDFDNSIEQQQADYSAIINQPQWQRLLQLLQQAESSGATVISCTAKPYTYYSHLQSRLMPLQLVTNAPINCQLLQQEIFGPVLPLITYQHIDEAITYIRQQPRSLALYLMTDDKVLQQRVLQQVHAGGVCINDSLLHVAQDDLPFGGTGLSGMGNYHGKEGFITFSHTKSIHQKGWFNSSKLIYPAYRKRFKMLLSWLLK